MKWLFGGMYTSTQTARGIEDPMVWVDARGNFHAIFHDMFEKCDASIALEGAGCKAPRDNVAHAYSKAADGALNWVYTGAALHLVAQDGGSMYMPEVSFTDGTKMGLACERPQMLVKDGIPTHVIIGGIPKALAMSDPLGAIPGGGLGDVFGNVDSKDWPGGATMVIPLVAEGADTDTVAPSNGGASDASATTAAPTTEDDSSGAIRTKGVSFASFVVIFLMIICYAH